MMIRRLFSHGEFAAFLFACFAYLFCRPVFGGMDGLSNWVSYLSAACLLAVACLWLLARGTASRGDPGKQMGGNPDG